MIATLTTALLFLTSISGHVLGQNSLVDEYELVEGWGELPEGMEWGMVSAVAVDGNGLVYVLRRREPPVIILDESGKFLTSWGAGLFTQPHGLRLDSKGFIWATSVSESFRGGKGHQVFKFSPEGQLLLTLGSPDVAGDGANTFNGPSDVAVAPNGEFFVSDGYGNSRVVKFSETGQFLKAWGRKGTAAGQFDLPHSIVMDSRGRILVGDRENERVQVFDAEGNFVDQWTELGFPYGLYITEDNLLIVDAPRRGNKITIASARDGEVLGTVEGMGGHWIAADRAGNLYLATGDDGIKKLVKK